MPDVACTVNNCVHWSTGNACTAKRITVQTDGASATSASSMATSSTFSAKSLGATPAKDEADTACHTFQSQGIGNTLS